MLSKEAPEPARGASKIVFNGLSKSFPLEKVLEQWNQAYPSPHIAKVAEKILEHQQKGGHLADMLEPLEAEFIHESGSDPAFYEAMRREAKDIGAPLPERAKERL